MDVGPARQVGGIDLHHRSNDHQAPVRPGGGQGVQKLDVHALVDHAVEAEPWMRRASLVRGVRLRLAGLGEMPAVHAGGKGMDIGVAAALGLIEAVAAGEDQVRLGQELAFEIHQLRRREAEVRQLVHAVVDDAGRRKMPGEVQHHRCVVPADQRTLPLRQEPIQQLAQFRGLLGGAQALREHRLGDDHAMLGVDADFEPRARVPLPHRLFPVDHHAVPREAAHQVLGALEDEVPTQVGKANDRRLPYTPTLVATIATAHASNHLMVPHENSQASLCSAELYLLGFVPFLLRLNRLPVFIWWACCLRDHAKSCSLAVLSATQSS